MTLPIGQNVLKLDSSKSKPLWIMLCLWLFENNIHAGQSYHTIVFITVWKQLCWTNPTAHQIYKSRHYWLFSKLWEQLEWMSMMEVLRWGLWRFGKGQREPSTCYSPAVIRMVQSWVLWSSCPFLMSITVQKTGVRKQASLLNQNCIQLSMCFNYVLEQSYYVK